MSINHFSSDKVLQFSHHKPVASECPPSISQARGIHKRSTVLRRTRPAWRKEAPRFVLDTMLLLIQPKITKTRDPFVLRPVFLASEISKPFHVRDLGTQSVPLSQTSTLDFEKTQGQSFALFTFKFCWI